MRAIACVIVLCMQSMHALSLNSKFLMTTRKKHFLCFIATQIDQSSPPVVRNVSSTDRRKHRKCLELFSKLKRKRNRRKIFVMEAKFKRITITISLIASGLKNSYFPLIHLPSCIGQFVIGQFAIGQINKPKYHIQSCSLNQPISISE